MKKTQTRDILSALASSPFRRRFHLGSKELAYLAEKTLPVMLEHGRQFIRDRLAPAQPKNDGKQTPMRGHPIFIAQHATATCCRGCLEKWHHIPQGRELTEEEIDYVLAILAQWLTSQTASRIAAPDQARTTQPLFSTEERPGTTDKRG